MKNKKYKLLIFIAVAISTFSYSQDKDLSWEALSEQYEIPEWYTDARFGIWVHWGAQTVPEYGGGWYARHMYMQDVGKETFGKNAYPYHLKTYGHPSEVGYKDVINEWKAEKLDTDALLKYFTEDLGAKYFMALAHHHDNFDNWNSIHQEWNSVNMGPKRDIIGEFSKSAKKYGVPFGVTTHDERFFDWNLPAFGSDDSGPYKGVPYDGNLTKADGKGTWWDGFDPANLYGLPPEQRTAAWEEAWKANWLLRMQDLLTNYDIDYMWFDGRGFPYGEYGKEAFRTFYNHNLNENGEITAVIAGKIPGRDPGILHDIEQGVENKISPVPWQSICSFTHWFYKKDDPSRHDARSTIELLVDVVSKNGNFVLNVELLPDGSIPPEHKLILDEFGDWFQLNSEAIYASKPWKVHGDNLYSSFIDPNSSNKNLANMNPEDLKKMEDKQFNNRTKDTPPYGPNEVRFTTKGDVLYMIVLNPTEGDIKIPALGLKSQYNPKKIRSITLIGSDEKIKFKQERDKLILNVPAHRPNAYAAVFVVSGAL
ncbi:alpha-L-fucosidase [Formosa sp. PL04]|uniref:alpha-L-fucosidase n=1 Tax=Formosa sp. PL04 TaxID=3081755 RepID=UPI002982705E|nr:alpha-L-fucosidase [Formosa sp. PL04]MDW5290280.1 alpha-L-fucosidase [Formosa sp. PL04]